MYNAKAYSAASATSPLASGTVARREPTAGDVQIEILFCGICHSTKYVMSGRTSCRRSTLRSRP
jgi:D-arabinose 1-dehydrogenase-like Zn-dependent alcohol dehydrogenase